MARAGHQWLNPSLRVTYSTLSSSTQRRSISFSRVFWRRAERWVVMPSLVRPFLLSPQVRTSKKELTKGLRLWLGFHDRKETDVLQLICSASVNPASAWRRPAESDIMSLCFGH